MLGAMKMTLHTLFRKAVCEADALPSDFSDVDNLCLKLFSGNQLTEREVLEAKPSHLSTS